MLRRSFIVSVLLCCVALSVAGCRKGNPSRNQTGNSAGGDSAEAALAAERAVVDSVVEKIADPIANEMVTGLGLDQTDYAKKHALHMACGMGDEERVKALLAAGADVNVKDEPNGMTPLHYSVSVFGGEKIAPLLIAAKADVNARNNAGQTPLYCSMLSGSRNLPLKCVELLLGAKADPNIPDLTGDTPLHLAAGRGGDRIAKALIDAGAKIEAKNDRGETPLFIAAALNWDACIGVLLKAKADIGVRNNDGWSVLAIAYEYSCLDAVSELEKAGATEASWTPLHLAALRGDAKAVDQQKTGGASMDARDVYGRTPLFWAASVGSHDVVKYLLAAGCDAKSGDKTRMTPLDAAARAGSVAIVEALLNAGASASDTDDAGLSPLHYAADSGQGSQVVQILLKAGAKVNQRTKSGQTPLHLAIRADDAESVKVLLNGGADVLARDNNGQSCEELSFGSSFETRALVREKAEIEAEAQMERILSRYAAEPGKTPLKAGDLTATTPQTAIRKLIRALYGQDKKSYLGVLEGTEKDIAVMESMFEFVSAYIDFRKAMIAAYGPHALREYGAAKVSGVMTASIDVIDEDLLDDLKMETSGDKATCMSILRAGGQLRLTRHDGLWKIEANSLFPDVSEELGGFFKSFSGELRRMIPYVGKEGITILALKQMAADGKFDE